MMQKTILTAVGPNMEQVLQAVSLSSFTRFASRHGYTVQVERIAVDDGDRWTSTAKIARWEKVHFIRAALEWSDVVVWFDADVLVCRTDTDILDELGPTDYQGLVLHSVPNDNRTNPNTGVWVLRRSEKAFRFLNTVMEIGMPEGPWADQGAVLRAFDWILGDERYHGAQMPSLPSEFMNGTAWLPFGWNHPYLERYIGRAALPDPFAIHFMGMSALDRLRCMKEVAVRYEIPLQLGGSDDTHRTKAPHARVCRTRISA